MHLVHIKGEGFLGLGGEGLLEDLGGDEGVAVAVAADPAAHLHEARQLQRAPAAVAAGEAVFEVGVEARQLAQEAVIEVGQAIAHLVHHRQFFGAQHAGLPQREHRAAQGLVVGLAFFGGELHAVALVEQAGDGHLAVEDALALHLGGVGGEHRRHLGGVEEGGQLATAHAGLEGALQSVGKAAFLGRRAGDLVGAGAADVVLVFGDVRQVREVAEGAHHVDGLVAGQRIEGGLQLAAGGVVLVAAEADRALADRLDQVEHGLALLGAHGVAEHPAKQADVVAEGQVLVFAGVVFAHGLILSVAVGAEGAAVPHARIRPRMPAIGAYPDAALRKPQRAANAPCLSIPQTPFNPAEPLP